MYKSSVWKYSFGIRFLCIIAILLSSYSLYVKHRIAKDSSYEAMCDISERIKCTKVFDSKTLTNYTNLNHVYN
ncbi:Vitamin K epoxide reductase complex subunit 1 [Pseudolycoriella hygida]|uniref:vitamin-K-epoxide reductase (warfarin-sensitive) n=1 Tax=Pseudolycoriella hygida TaxID=35572 RepID=A0A9Q0MVS8_9DIPT|nr:Vitamin K epoxide reductase complex subunit 1 [Pseudolycoriella hygida]